MGKRRARHRRGLEPEGTARITPLRPANLGLEAPSSLVAPTGVVAPEALPALFHVDVGLRSLIPLNERASQFLAQAGEAGELALLEVGAGAVRTRRRVQLHSASPDRSRHVSLLAEPVGDSQAQVLVLPLTWRVDLDTAPDTRLTPREREVLELLLAGTSPKEIADSLRIRPNTVRTYLKSLHRIFQVSTRAELVASLTLSARPHLDQVDTLPGFPRLVPVEREAQRARSGSRGQGRSR